MAKPRAQLGRGFSGIGKRGSSRAKEDAPREFLTPRAGATREARDLGILNDLADALNREMDDVLAYQALG